MMKNWLARARTLLGSTDPSLKLYSMEYCYYCRKVQRAANELGLRLETVDVFGNREERQRLRAATGRTRVPVLRIEDDEGKEHFLPESDEIIEYLRQLVAEHRDAESPRGDSSDSFKTP